LLWPSCYGLSVSHDRGNDKTALATGLINDLFDSLLVLKF
jgi:hypothetical protein